ncbi:MAG: Protein translocase subunit SecF [Ktedonobacterales bacterium]|nr:MAG: Protein translocase subunit SecF [Ktedonobacterales bacterium]
MFHLTRYRYWFFLISGIVIVPGLLALALWGLNVGIDFTGGTTVDIVFQTKNVTPTQIQDVFAGKPFNAQDTSVYASTDIKSASIPPSRYVYVQFSRPIGTSEEATVQQRLADPKYKLPNANIVKTDYDITVGGKQVSQIVFLFDSAVTTKQVEAALQNLPATDLPPATTNSGQSATPTAAASATASPAATATSTATPTATGTPAPTAQTFPVDVTSVMLGENNQIYQVNTQTDLVNTSAGKNTLPQIITKLQDQFGPLYVLDKNVIGGAIAGETTRAAFLAVAIASLAILGYIAIAFRKVGSVRQAARFGASAVIALLHDALVVLGLWAIFGHFFNFKVDTLFLTAVLTVIGFSVHDTIVVFDRIRENLGRRTGESFNSVVDTSLIQTMSRSLNTSLTVLLVLAAQTLFGGESIREFVLALLIGIASGTYSSIFNASMILSIWENREYRTWFRKRAPAAPATKRVGTLTGAGSR